MRIHHLRLRFSNAYLLVGARPILVDTGSPNETKAIWAQLRQYNVNFSDLALIIHTHVHSDHMGSTAEIVAEAKCPIAYHPADQPIVTRSHNGRLKGIGMRGWIMSRIFSDAKFEAANADFQLHEDMSLEPFGCDASVLETPGHTHGSISIVTAKGDAIVGDVLMGGFAGGNLLPTKPNYHYFAEDVDQTLRSIDKILARASGSLFVGHGGPLTHRAVTSWRNRMNRTFS